jgi:hypothetical protein
VAKDKRFDGLLAAIAPAATSKAYKDSNPKASLRMILAGGYEFHVADRRYVTYTGYLPGSRTTIAMIWVDVEQGVSAGVFGHERDIGVDVISRSLNAKEFPEVLIREIRGWGSANLMTISEASFLDYSGKEEDISRYFRQQ